MDDLTQEFIAESQDGLDRMERCLTELETRPQDSQQLVAEIFRAVHTIKGTTGFLGFGRLEKLAHAGEHLLGSLRDGRLPVTEELISGLLRLLDGLRAILNLIEETGSEGSRAGDEDSALIAELAMLNGEEAPSQLAEKPAPVVPIKVAEEAPSPASLEAGSAAANTQTSGSSSGDKTLRIDVEVLNRMMNLVGELVLTRNQMLQSGVESTNFPELARRLDSVTADLRETVMQARMQPVGNLFGKFPRMVRDLARTCGREVRIEFSGQETGLDKSLLEAIKDPLTHAVRNAVDHGIESPADRVLAGKSAEGCLRLRAFHQSGSVVIEVSDDGAGIAMERVLAKAVERGLVVPEQAKEMTEREALQLIFLPGFSTAAAVTTVSGRGVGMDVVRANVEKVGGSVELESKVGVGTTLRLRVPLTLAIVPALVVRSGGQSFALPQTALVELVYIPARDREKVVERVGASEVYRLRERLLPMVWLDRLLSLKNETEAHGFYMAVLEAEGCRYGLVVDDLLAPEEIVVKPLSAVLREIGLFSGATVLGNGTLALILDIAATAARAGVKPVMEEQEQEAVEVRQDEASFLVFEDRARERTALPLGVVERIESVPISRVEYASGRALLQYRGELLQLRDDGNVLEDMDGLQDEEASVTILICGDPQTKSGRMGIVVRKVLDVSDGNMLEKDAANGEMDLALVNERLTTIFRGFAGEVGKSWREVA
ncbi:chemotaxis protein CheA [Edaphobacter sp. 12200R-103]|uniref:chemotaxis protein CheA n=1 Tax=Edaphobacter sp. 12200R-103 TaxID=2703788 RepID=UPI00138C7428|nr:chemotaxis protein CheA [Edaphobacter sp. 12200R-103]QHS51468.1 chemotaxis protein CheA [Edaphobacter sp. 12200R-103]